MKKILVLMGSPRKGNTFRACEEFGKFLQETCPAEFEYVWLKDARITPCTGCFVCFPHGEEKCPNRDDDVRIIRQKMEDADGVIFASPVYSANISGQMKIFIDRISYTGHRPRFFGRKAFILSTTGMFGAGDVVKYLRTLAWAWGFEVAGQAALVTPNPPVPPARVEQNTAILRKESAGFSAALLRTIPRRPSFSEVIYYFGLKGMMATLERVSPADYRYWKERGLLLPETRWFMDVPVNPVYRALGRAAECIVPWWFGADAGK